MKRKAPTVRRQPELTRERAAALAEILRALAHPLRLRIIALLVCGDTHVNNIVERLGAPQALVSQQLRILRMSRLVDVTRENGRSIYRIAEPHLCDLLQCMDGCSVA